MLAAHRADHIGVVCDKGVHLVKAHGVHVHIAVNVPDELVGPVPGLAGLTVQQRIGEPGHMAGGDPGLGVHDDGGVQAHVVGALLDELLPPGFLHVILELHSQRTVIPGVGETAVDLAAGEDIAPALAQVDDHVHGLFAAFHVQPLLYMMNFACPQQKAPRAL